MSDNTAIEWSEATWNPTTGCNRVSPGCDNCYALTLAKRLKGMGSAKYQTDGDPRTSGPGFGLAVHDDALSIPLRWRRPRRIFVNSMSDLFHDEVPDPFIGKVFAVMRAADQHVFQVLTKRHARMRSLLAGNVHDWYVAELRTLAPGLAPTWPLPNVWLGVSVEDQKWADIRIPALLDTPAAVRWISAEPLLGPVDLTCIARPSAQQPEMLLDVLGRRYGVPGIWQAPMSAGLDWVIVGAESGPGARPMDQSWARSLRDQCAADGVPFFFKQWGEWCHQDQLHPDVWTQIDAAINLGGEQHPQPMRVGKKAAGRLLDGRTWDEYPTAVAHG